MMIKKGKNTAAKAGIGYTVGNILVKGINFVSLPFFSRLMTTDQFGVYNVFVSYEAILYLIIGFAMHSSLRTANLEYKGKIDEFTSSISIVYILSTAVMLGIVLAFGQWLEPLLGFSTPILVFLVIYSFGSAVLVLYNNRISIDYEYKIFLLISVINSVGNILLSLALMFTVCSEKRDLGRILGVTITMFAIAVVLLISLFRRARPRVNKKYWKFSFLYSIPIVPHGVSQVLLGQFDRIMIRNIVSDSAAGIYSLAGNIKLILTIITTSIATAWGNWFYEQMEKNDIEKIKKYAVLITAMFTVLCVGMMGISPELIFVLGGKEYDAGKYVAIPMIVDAVILFIYNVIVQSEYYKKKTVNIMIGTIVAAVIDIVLNVVFIPMYGFVAAAYTTLFAYICYLILHLVISYRLVKFSVLPAKWLTLFISIVTVNAFLDIVFIEVIWLRWLICLAFAVPITAILAVNYLKDRKNKAKPSNK